MGKYCIGCGAAIEGQKKLCESCETKNKAIKNKPSKEKVGKTLAAEALTAFRAPSGSGEIALPSAMQFSGAAEETLGLISVLKDGISGLLAAFKRTLKDKKRLALVIGLAVCWLLIGILTALNIFPKLTGFFAWLTAARGNLIGGTVGKGIFASFVTQLIFQRGFLTSVKGGIRQVTGGLKNANNTLPRLLLGAGAGLIASNLMGPSQWQNTAVCIAAAALSAKALTYEGFLRRLLTSLLPKMSGEGISCFMQGWAAGFALFIAASFIPGIYNGYIAGAAASAAGIVMLVVKKAKKEAE